MQLFEYLLINVEYSFPEISISRILPQRSDVNLGTFLLPIYSQFMDRQQNMFPLICLQFAQLFFVYSLYFLTPK